MHNSHPQYNNNKTHLHLCATILSNQYGPRYDWTAFEQSILLGAYFWGYALTSIPTGILCEKYGGKDVVTYIFATCVVLTALGPMMSHFPVWVSCIMRFLVGLTSVSGLVTIGLGIRIQCVIFYAVSRAVSIRPSIKSFPNGRHRTRKANSCRLWLAEQSER